MLHDVQLIGSIFGPVCRCGGVSLNVQVSVVDESNAVICLLSLSFFVAVF